MVSGTVVVDLSSCNPLATRQMAAELAEKGIALLDAPVSGGVLRARQGTLAVMVGGDRAAFERVRPILATFGSHITYVGGSGAGHAAKAINNLLSAATLTITAEGVLLAAKAGLDPQVFIDVVNHSSGRSNSSEVKFPQFILNRRFDSGFSLGLMHKDLTIAERMARELGVPMRVAGLIRQLWGDAVGQGGAAADHTAFFQFMERWSGVTLEPGESGPAT